MQIAIVGIYTPNYQDLVDITILKNKFPYCERHGYMPVFQQIEGNSYNNDSGFKKLEVILDLFEREPNLDWAFYTDCDAMITNMKIKLEEKINYLNAHTHVALCTDCNNINAGQFLIRNSPIGRDYLKHLISLKPKYVNHDWHEQQAMIEASWKFKDAIHIYPQRVMNSYVYANHGADVPVDILGYSGEWKPGDFIQHWPGYPFDKRMVTAQNLLSQVVQ